MHQCTEDGQEYAQYAEIMLPMDYQEVAKWAGTTTGQRGSEYQEFKQRKAERVLNLLGHLFPGISSCIENYESSTPLTYCDYTGTTNGSTYGILHDKNAPELTSVSQRTKIPKKVEMLFNGLDEHIFAFTNSSIASRLVKALSKDFDYVLFICGFIVFVFLMISFGRIEISLMAFTPLVIAWIWILGIMGLTGISFNIVNIILATFIFGMGDDYSIFVTEGLSYEYRYGRSMLSQFKNSIILSSSIMFIGIGMLIFAKHPAMKSLAEVTIIGMLSVVLMAYIIPPFIFKWLTQKKGKARKQPITIANFCRTIFAFSFFICGTIFMSLAAFFLLTIGGKSERHKQQYHKLLQNIMRFIAWGMPQVSYRVDNPHGEDFSKPSSRYEAELALLVRSAWRSINILPIPINVYYPPKEERVSHFRPGMDFFRISVLNTFFTFAAILYGYPSMFYHHIKKKLKTES